MNRVLLTVTLSVVFSLATTSSCSRQADEPPQPEQQAQPQTVEQAAAPAPVDPATVGDAGQALALGNQLLENNKTEEAIQMFLRAVELNPDLADAYFQLGIAYALIEKERRDAALADGSAAAAVEEEPADNSKGKKKASSKQEEQLTESERAFKKAVDAYQRIIDKNPDDHVAYFNLGRAYNKLNEDEDAAKALKQAVKLNPEDAEYQIELGAILIKLAQYREAIPPLKKALELDPENSKALGLLEDAQAGRSRLDYARKEAEKNSNSNSSAKTGDDSDKGEGTNETRDKEQNEAAPKAPSNTKQDQKSANRPN